MLNFVQFASVLGGLVQLGIATEQQITAAVNAHRGTVLTDAECNALLDAVAADADRRKALADADAVTADTDKAAGR